MNDKFLYEKVYNTLKDKILTKSYKPNQKLPTELELANIYDVSRITIKKALAHLREAGLIYSVRGSGSYVMPNPNLESYENISRENGKSNIITMILPFNMNESNFMETINGASEYLGQKGYYLNIRSNISSVAEERNILSSYKNIAGILHFPLFGNHNISIYNKLFVEKYPIVMIDRSIECLPMNYVKTDNFQGGYDATVHLLELNHKNIGFVCDIGLEKILPLRDRYLGYCAAMEKYSELKIERIFTGFNKKYHHEQNDDTMRKIIETYIKNDVTAVFAANDLIASYFISTATSMGYDIPNDFSVIGFDNDAALSKYFFKQITTMSQEFYKMGNLAAQNLVNLIEGKKDKVKINLPATLIRKETCVKI